MAADAVKKDLSFSENSKDYFRQSLREAFTQRRVETAPQVEAYLVDVLNYYLLATNLFNEEDPSGKKTRETLAEMMLRAANSAPKQRYELLKKLGDSALYISGFFADSFQRKVIDVDYYMDMGATAYHSLSREIYEDSFSQMYLEISRKFNIFVDVFMLMGRKTMAPEQDNILRLMEYQAKTGSGVAQDILLEKGIFTNPQNLKQAKNQ